MVYKCKNCDQVCKTKYSLQVHIQIKHSKVQKLKCVKCEKHFMNKYSFNKHVRQVHPSKLHSCTFCGSSFKVSIRII
jgi:hypothetical protein